MKNNLIQFPSPSILTDIVRQARKFTVVDLGQLTARERLELDCAVSHRLLVKGLGGPFPVLKNVWAAPGYEFAKERAAEIAFTRYLSTSFSRAA